MLFGHHSVDKTVDEHVRELASLARDPQTLIVLDTSILTYLYKLHEAARQEFFRWSDAVAAAGRLVVPAWAASEYLASVTSKTLDAYTPKSKEASQSRKLLDGLLETSSLFVDAATLQRIGFGGDRDAFLAGFRNAINALTPFTKVFSQAFDPGLIHQEIDRHLSSAILDSDLSSLCVQATAVSNGRFEHRLPPGFRDGGKPENRLGDLIIWFEILDKAAQSQVDFPKVLFITRDEKDDWVYAPKMRKELVGDMRKTVGNSQPAIKLVDPRLVSEFRRKVGHSNIAIASLDRLVEGLSKTDPTLVGQLAAAIQINIAQLMPSQDDAAHASASSADDQLQPAIDPAPAAGGSAEPVQAPVPEEKPGVEVAEAAEPAPPKLQYEGEALRDREYQADAPSDINDIIRALKSQSWYTQNPAVSKIRTLRERDDLPPSSWFVLGRNIYQAACGNSQKAMEFIAALESQLRWFANDTRQHVLAGMLYEVYFDSRGQFRQTAKFEYADKLLSTVAREGFADALEFITFHLFPYRDRLKFLPGNTGRTAIRIITAPIDPADIGEPQSPGEEQGAPIAQVQSVLLGGQELMRDVANEHENSWNRLLGSKLSPERIRQRISDELAIPNWALTLDTQPPTQADSELTVPDGKEFDPSLALLHKS